MIERQGPREGHDSLRCRVRHGARLQNAAPTRRYDRALPRFELGDREAQVWHIPEIDVEHGNPVLLGERGSQRRPRRCDEDVEPAEVRDERSSRPPPRPLTSPRMATARPPASVIEVTVALSPSSSGSSRPTAAPSAAKALAKAAPRPIAAPVTRTTFPSNEPGIAVLPLNRPINPMNGARLPPAADVRQVATGRTRRSSASTIAVRVRRRRAGAASLLRAHVPVPGRARAVGLESGGAAAGTTDTRPRHGAPPEPGRGEELERPAELELEAQAIRHPVTALLEVRQIAEHGAALVGGGDHREADGSPASRRREATERPLAPARSGRGSSV